MPPLPAPTRVTFERGRVATVVQADAGGSDRRRIAGTLVPYGVEGRASDGYLYVFEAGSVTPGRDRTPLLMGHDRNQPVGVLADFSSADDGASGSFAIDSTGAGDEALVQASSGSRGGFSVGAELILYSFDESGDELVIRVQQAELLETSLVSVGAYATAAVSSVAASHPQGGTVPPTPTAQNGATASPVVPPGDVAAQTPPASAGTVAASPAAFAELHAGHPAIVVGEPGRPTLTATQYVGAMVRAMNGDRSARQLIEAALGVSHLVDNPGVLPPTYTSEILGEVDQPRPLHGLVRTPPLPDTGMQIHKPIWTTKPNGGWMADDTAAPATNTPKIGLQDVAVRQWAYAFACSVAVMERSSPDWVEAVYRQSVADFYADVEAAIAALLPAVDGAATIGAGIAAVWTASKRVANVLLMAPDVFGDMFDAAGPPPRWVSGSLDASMNGRVGGLEPVVSGDLAAGALYVGARNAIEQRESNPIRLSANNIGAMNVEVGVTAFATFDVEVPGAWVKVTDAAPAV